MTEFPVRRNTLLLAAAMAVSSATLQLVAAVSSITFVLVSGLESLLGVALAPIALILLGSRPAGATVPETP